jgi:hypothetical protein
MVNPKPGKTPRALDVFDAATVFLLVWTIKNPRQLQS